MESSFFYHRRYEARWKSTNLAGILFPNMSTENTSLSSETQISQVTAQLSGQLVAKPTTSSFFESSATELSMGLLLGLVAGLVLGFLGYKFFRFSIRRRAEVEAEEIVQEIKDEVELQILDQKERIQEIETELWTKEEKAMLQTEERIEEMEETAKEKKQKYDDHYSQIRRKSLDQEKEVVTEEERIKTLESKSKTLKDLFKQEQSQYVSALESKAGTPKTEAMAQVIDFLTQESLSRLSKIQEIEAEEMKEHSEARAKTILARILDRFARPYSSERGIPGVYLETEEQRKIIFDEAGENQKLLTELTGCDIVLEDNMPLIGVAGFDPVRREWTRRILERLLKEKKPVTIEFVRKTAENIRRDLFGQIKKDGDTIAKELGLESLHPEVRQMMGALRYRYSFTQNQYFHCGEVGWLCGLLASELQSGVSVKKARRAGLLHDLGKAMDHELDGGHAVIGANFIKDRGEGPEIVHAVRSHHYDEQPSSDLAFLVIAADAISGARPGARRSTIESYNQKVSELQDIARSFDGVTDCFVLSGGREVRVLVNSKKVDDTSALKMSKQMAKRIETECNYPGQIKVVIVRETVAVEQKAGRQ